MGGGTFSRLFSPVYLALLDDHFMGFLSHDAAVKPHLCPVDHWKRQTPGLMVLDKNRDRLRVRLWYLCSGRRGASGWGCPGHSSAGSVSEGGEKQQILGSDVQESAEDRRLPPPPHPPGLSLLQGGALGLHGVVDDAAGPPGEVHGDQGVLGHASLWRGETGHGGWGVEEGQRSNEPDTLTGA